jgi:hypothetical protein
LEKKIINNSGVRKPRERRRGKEDQGKKTRERRRGKEDQGKKQHYLFMENPWAGSSK